jgi:hypothetical protein
VVVEARDQGPDSAQGVQQLVEMVVLAVPILALLEQQIRGGGGGGGAYTAPGWAAIQVAGGSGVVIIKIPDTRTASFSGGVTSTTSTAVAGYNIYTVTATSNTNETVTFS